MNSRVLKLTNAQNQIYDLESKALDTVSNSYPDIRNYVKSFLPQLYDDSKNILQFELTMANNILMKFGLYKPFGPYMEILNGNAEGIWSIPELPEALVTDRELSLVLDNTFEDIRNAITAKFEKGGEDLKKSACPSKVVPSMSTYTDVILKNLTTELSNAKNKFTDDVRKKRDEIKKNFQTFHDSNSNCFNKPTNALSESCFSTLVSLIEVHQQFPVSKSHFSSPKRDQTSTPMRVP